MSGARPLLSVVLSFRNEEEVLPELVARLAKALGGEALDYELLFVNDASTDHSLAVLEAERASNPRIKIVTMSRRFGVAPCVMAGMELARGDAVAYMDADLQDPPELLPELVARWREGAEVVYTVRTARRGESAAKRLITRAAYRLIRLASEIELPIEAGDFKLLSRRALDRLLELPERELYMRGLVAWVGFRQVAVPYERAPRAAGHSHFPLLRSWGPARSFAAALTSFSHAPLLAFLVLGAAGCALSLGALVAVALLRAAGIAWPHGAGLVAFALLLWATLALGIGSIGLYLARIHREVLGRPRYVIESTIGFDERA
ncbi:MAG TPA: glycosyltransferase family 2 protein [Myxococcota bacterium]|nr:glycosyltransferase family 2 protein [Myxococcota bacterium]